MATGKEPRPELSRRRNEVIELLSDGFSRDALGVDEFEARVDRAHRATDVGALDSLVADLGAPPSSDSEQLIARPRPSEALTVQRPRHRSIISVLGGATRRGQWRVPETLKVVCVLGNTVVDFREALIGPGVTEVKLVGVLSSVTILVPPDLAVESDGIGVLGEVRTMDRAPPALEDDTPVVRITGVTVLGEVDVETRLPGESKRDAKRRLRRQRKLAEKRPPSLRA